MIFLFFTGRNLFSDLPEDIELKAIQSKDENQEEEATAPQEENKQLSLYPSDSFVYGNAYSSPAVENKEEETEESENVDTEAQVLEEPAEEEGGDND